MAPQTRRCLHPHGVQEVFEELRALGKSNEEIFVAAYQDLKQLARKMLGREPAGNSMNASRLLNELWLRQFGKSTTEFDWTSGTHFFNGMARAMRRLLIDHARQRRALIRGNGEISSLAPGASRSRHRITSRSPEHQEQELAAREGGSSVGIRTVFSSA